jgi:hypothetical protein
VVDCLDKSIASVAFISFLLDVDYLLGWSMERCSGSYDNPSSSVSSLIRT